MVVDSLKKENIAEYVIFMFYLHDLVRVHDFDIQKIMEQMVGNNSADSLEESYLISVNDWFSDFISKIRDEGVEKEGNISELKEVIEELNYLHFLALNEWKDQEYLDLYKNNKELISEYALKHGKAGKSEIELMLHSLYMIYLLRIQGKEVTKETQEAVKGFKEMISILSLKYKVIKDLG
jgi:hypothetical protein